MKKQLIYKFTVCFLAIYTGVIATGCLQRIMASLARHGLMSWKEYLYDSKVILVMATYLAYKHFAKMLDVNKVDFYKSLLHKNLLFLAGLIIATRLVFSQTPNLFDMYMKPFILLFFIW